MSREIKFRMVYQTTGEIIGYTDVYKLLRNGNDELPDYGKAILHGVSFDQYTGLKDKNGKEIYDGDRIKIEGSDTVYIVRYGRGVWVARFGDEPGNNICLYHYVRKDKVLYAEVIGNIHENRELVGGEE